MTRVALVLVLLFAPSLAAAEDTELPARYLAIARDAARAGNCDVVLSIDVRITAQWPDFHARVFVLDDAIAACLANPHPVVEAPLPQPPLSAGRITAQVAAGTALTAGGLILGVVGGFYVDEEASRRNDCVTHCFGHQLINASFAVTLATPLGIWLIGNLGDQHGSYPATVVGTAIGLALAATPLYLNAWDELSVASAVAFTALPVLGGVIGFNLTRRTREPAHVGSLLVVRDGSVSFGAPVVTHQHATTHVSLLSGSF